MNEHWAPDLHADVVLVVVDMQEVFAQATPWQVPGFDALVAPVRALVDAFSPRCIFTRFVYRDPDHWRGDAWRDYYRRWAFLKGRPDLEEIVGALRPLAQRIVDKPGYSCTAEPAFVEAVRVLGGRRLVFAGAETDICVLASVLGAIDCGWPCALVVDACASGSVSGHEAALRILDRLPEQVQLLDTHHLVPGGVPYGPA